VALGLTADETIASMSEWARPRMPLVGCTDIAPCGDSVAMLFQLPIKLSL
jgi:hypothetical protein